MVYRPAGRHFQQQFDIMLSGRVVPSDIQLQINKRYRWYSSDGVHGVITSAKAGVNYAIGDVCQSFCQSVCHSLCRITAKIISRFSDVMIGLIPIGRIY